MTLNNALEAARQRPVQENEVSVIFRRGDTGLAYAVNVGGGLRWRLAAARGAGKCDKLALDLDDHYADDWEAAVVDYTESGMAMTNHAVLLIGKGGALVTVRQVTMELPKGGRNGCPD